jgi:hypothetical protein
MARGNGVEMRAIPRAVSAGLGVLAGSLSASTARACAFCVQSQAHQALELSLLAGFFSLLPIALVAAVWAYAKKIERFEDPEA